MRHCARSEPGIINSPKLFTPLPEYPRQKTALRLRL
jgi:hypothetical protein